MSAEELARRAVACKGWRLIPGMLSFGAHRFGDESRTRRWTRHHWDHGRVVLRASSWDIDTARFPVLHPDALPDLDDPATLGCLLALVREAWGYPGAHCVYCPHMEEWHVVKSPDGEWAGLALATEAEALVCALEAAP